MTRRSRRDINFRLFPKDQTIVALSTTEAEYMAAIEAGKEIAWMQNILSEFGYSAQAASVK